MGTDGVKEVVERFVGVLAAVGFHIFHPGIGVLLFSGLDSLVDQYKLGFYHVTGEKPYNCFKFLSSNMDTTQGDRYMLHNFDDEPNLNYLGTTTPDIISIPIPSHVLSNAFSA